MNIVTRYSIIDTLGSEIPAANVLKIGDSYSVHNLMTGDEIEVNTLSEAEAVASAMRNRNQSNYNRKEHWKEVVDNLYIT